MTMLQHIPCNIAFMCYNSNKFYISCYEYSSEQYKNASLQMIHPLFRVPHCPKQKKMCHQMPKGTIFFLYLAVSLICLLIYESSSQWDLHRDLYEVIGQSRIEENVFLTWENEIKKHLAATSNAVMPVLMPFTWGDCI